MGTNLKIEPYYRKKQTLSDELKFAMRKRWSEPVSVRVDQSHIEFFRGCLAAGIQDADIVLQMIEKYNECHITED